ncbi:hypothetical protein AB1L30_11635 [Bremerella sp. JC817]|uniref:hypothetical protein n=1 Tax=Bremerella sp. JC817 TaxID=3231756 RepID=UPI00345B21F1
MVAILLGAIGIPWHLFKFYHCTVIMRVFSSGGQLPWTSDPAEAFIGGLSQAQNEVLLLLFAYHVLSILLAVALLMGGISILWKRTPKTLKRLKRTLQFGVVLVVASFVLNLVIDFETWRLGVELLTHGDPTRLAQKREFLVRASVLTAALHLTIDLFYFLYFMVGGWLLARESEGLKWANAERFTFGPVATRPSSLQEGIALGTFSWSALAIVVGLAGMLFNGVVLWLLITSIYVLSERSINYSPPLMVQGLESILDQWLYLVAVDRFVWFMLGLAILICGVQVARGASDWLGRLRRVFMVSLWTNILSAVLAATLVYFWVGKVASLPKSQQQMPQLGRQAMLFYAAIAVIGAIYLIYFGLGVRFTGRDMKRMPDV